MIKNSIVTLVLFLTFQYVSAQIQFNGKELIKVVYQQSYNDQVSENQNPIWVFSDVDNTLITSRDQWQLKSSYPFEMTFVQHKTNNYTQITFLNETESVAMDDSTSISKQSFELLDETKEILGYRCKKAKTSINSNTIEIWYTNDLNVKGSPSVLGQNLGLVLEYVRNGNFVIRAESINEVSVKLPDFIVKMNPEKMDKIDYQDKVWKSRFTTIPIFSNQQINFSDTQDLKDGIMHFANGTIALKKIKFPELNSHHQIFLDLTEQSNGDAYDRTGTVFMIPMDKKQSFLDGLQNGVSILPIFENGNGKKYQGVVATENYSPAVELMRFFTPFGVNHFNERVTLKGIRWQDSAFYRQEITPYASILSNREVYIGVFIGNYDKGGHIISTHITIHNDEETDIPLKQVVPLFNTVNIMEMAGQQYGTMFDNDNGLLVSINLKKDIINAQLIYTTTGHGGWGNGDEFVPKKNTILLDGRVVFDLTPWRTDCGSYRLYNPVSGNFSNGLSSSDYSRSNWCPGTVTNPYYIDLGDLKAGLHEIQVKIPQGKPEGNSFSSWNVSGVLIGE